MSSLRQKTGTKDENQEFAFNSSILKSRNEYSNILENEQSSLIMTNSKKPEFDYEDFLQN